MIYRIMWLPLHSGVKNAYRWSIIIIIIINRSVDDRLIGFLFVTDYRELTRDVIELTL